MQYRIRPPQQHLAKIIRDSQKLNLAEMSQELDYNFKEDADAEVRDYEKLEPILKDLYDRSIKVVKNLNNVASIDNEKSILDAVDVKKRQTFNEEMSAYVDVCLNGSANLANEAVRTIKFLSARTEENEKFSWKKVDNVEIYNKLLTYLANEGKIKDA